MSRRTSFARRLLFAVVSLCATVALAGASAFASPPTFRGSFGFPARPTGMAVEEATGNLLVPEITEDFDVVDVFGETGARLPAVRRWCSRA